MKLKSGCIFWPQIYRGPEPKFPRLDRDVKCDVAIIGSGVSGALIAYHLVKEGVDAVMVDRRPVGHGSTAASTGLLQYEIDTPLLELSRKIGKHRAIAAYQASVDSLLAFEPLVAELRDSCGLVARSSLYLASEEKDVPKLQAECDARRSMGIDVQFVKRRSLRDTFNLSRPAALWSRKAFEVDPFRLTLKLIERSVELGLHIFGETAIDRLTTRSEYVTLHSSSGPTVTASHVIFATGYETIHKLPEGLCRLTSTYALASEPLAGFSEWPGRFLIWEAARPYLYMRTTEDGRAIVGGEDEEAVDPAKRDGQIEKKAQILCDKFAAVFPKISIDTTCAWAGTFAQTKDGLPYIGTLPQYPRSYFALGYGGNGITFSLLAAQILRDLFLGVESERTTLFGFGR